MEKSTHFIKTCVAALFLLCLTVSSVVNCKKSSDYTKPRWNTYFPEEEKCQFSQVKHNLVQENDRLKEMETKLNRLQKDLDNTKKDCVSRNERSTYQVEQKMFRLETTLNEERQDIKGMQNTIRQLKEKMEMHQDTGQRTREMSEKLNVNINVLQSKYSELEKKFTEQLDQNVLAINTRTDHVGTIVANNQKTIEQQRELIESLQRENMEMQESLAHLSSNLSEIRKTVEYFGSKIRDLDSKVTLNDLSIQEIVAYGRFLLFILVFLSISVVMYRRRVYQLKETKKSTPQNNPVPLDPASREYKADLDEHTSRKFPVSRRTENSVGVVSFCDSGSDVHREIIESLTSSAKIPVRIRHTKVRHEDEISTIPPSKIVFVFVDANSRHIILENPDQEIGGFRRQTTEAVLGMGCDVFVLYVRDEVVVGESLYHSRLTSIERHQVLSTLKSKNRVLSLDLTLSDYQKKFLTAELQKAFK